ncbi:MAG: 23S rRNA (adenine(2503)-C(2))-methyltransferase RlmN [Bacteroidetes bacterium]|nr:23S rRNA (adenine(2503)-C(2))-methyltransferase RlmN [Bacteroidota bacterium]
MKAAKKNIRHLTQEDIAIELENLGEPNFRAKQVWQWIWQKNANGFEDMTNLAKPLREKLAANFIFYKMKTATQQISTDGTIKAGFRLYDGELVEGVLIPQEDRMTACISSQVGCSLTCSFCATAKLDRKRNLHFDEIYDQVAIINHEAEKKYNKHLTNIVFMGMGEPLLNYPNVIKAIERITAEDGLGIAPKRITVSTAGIAKMIKKLGDDKVKFNLALSLHAANDQKRSKIMPINDTNSLEILKEALIYFHSKTQTRITFEYVMLGGFNDTPEDAKELAQFARAVPCKINLIEYNPIEGGIYIKSSGNTMHRFKAYLEGAKLIVNLRRSRGEDIDAACGQLAGKDVRRVVSSEPK